MLKRALGVVVPRPRKPLGLSRRKSLAGSPPSCVAFVAVVAVSAVAAEVLRIEYGAVKICVRGARMINCSPALRRTATSKKRLAPGKAFAPKSSRTPKTPLEIGRAHV